jgi:UDP-glucose 4-epimerase
MKIAVLGANGYIGKYLTQLLASNTVTVIPVVRQTIDLTNFQQVQTWLQLVRPDVVINCATATGQFHISDLIYQDVQNNLDIFINFYNNSNLFDQFINIGSGAEFDRSTNIDHAPESDIFVKQPKDSYGYSKNIIARLAAEKEKFVTLRLFGCFNRNEPTHRLFQKFAKQSTVDIVDRYVDYISLEDFGIIVQHHVNNITISKDINCVYPEKYLLSEIFKLFQDIHGVTAQLSVIGTDLKNYTGSADRLSQLKLPLKGFIQGLKDYV